MRLLAIRRCRSRARTVGTGSDSVKPPGVSPGGFSVVEALV
ncbi:MAG TPA: hypothetical protein DEF41_14570 [Desulfovibrio sp.]|uniref:Uncharacterized protein n=1 Tax=Nitratidesulfovibrio vulgaris (strain ATCC 29579 / DSM 644 / CCUG 34227 / NCIMB 8303 / VKM B-1760 / Hildenborough) TaxID=882 RepID=Q729B8_NITV2|nr:hypothetical protein DVU_2433 [Nitratidesulfovibrio vulgaris str. Hildenborough]HBW17304.1 hypothetical protein [Desulfovibrio sp.]